VQLTRQLWTLARQFNKQFLKLGKYVGKLVIMKFDKAILKFNKAIHIKMQHIA
jgi:hypothetical protein